MKKRKIHRFLLKTVFLPRILTESRPNSRQMVDRRDLVKMACTFAAVELTSSADAAMETVDQPTDAVVSNA